MSKAKEAEAALEGLENERSVMLKEAEQKGLEIIREAEAIKKTKIAQGEARGKEREKNILEAAEQDKANRMKEMEVNIENQIGQYLIEGTGVGIDVNGLDVAALNLNGRSFKGWCKAA